MARALIRELDVNTIQTLRRTLAATVLAALLAALSPRSAGGMDGALYAFPLR